MYFDLFDPILYVFESLAFVYCISEDNAHGSSVVGLGDGFELLLPCGVPYLQSDFLIMDEYGFDFEVDADSSEVWGHEIVVAEFEEHIGFADSAIADDEQFDEVVIVLVFVHG